MVTLQTYFQVRESIPGLEPAATAPPVFFFFFFSVSVVRSWHSVPRVSAICRSERAARAIAQRLATTQAFGALLCDDTGDLSRSFRASFEKAVV